VDTKTTKDNTFGYSKIDFQQVEKLSVLEGGGPSGYVICLGRGDVWFAPVRVLRETKPRSSVDLTQCIKLGMRHVFDARRIFV
jgi:hypothetical protein